MLLIRCRFMLAERQQALSAKQARPQHAEERLVARAVPFSAHVPLPIRPVERLGSVAAPAPIAHRAIGVVRAIVEARFQQFVRAARGGRAAVRGELVVAAASWWVRHPVPVWQPDMQIYYDLYAPRSPDHYHYSIYSLNELTAPPRLRWYGL